MEEVGCAEVPTRQETIMVAEQQDSYVGQQEQREP